MRKCTFRVVYQGYLPLKLFVSVAGNAMSKREGLRGRMSMPMPMPCLERSENVSWS